MHKSFILHLWCLSSIYVTKYGYLVSLHWYTQNNVTVCCMIPSHPSRKMLCCSERLVKTWKIKRYPCIFSYSGPLFSDRADVPFTYCSTTLSHITWMSHIDLRNTIMRRCISGMTPLCHLLIIFFSPTLACRSPEAGTGGSDLSPVETSQHWWGGCAFCLSRLYKY